MQINNKKITFENIYGYNIYLYTVENEKNILMEHDLYIIS